MITSSAFSDNHIGKLLICTEVTRMRCPQSHPNIALYFGSPGMCRTQGLPSCDAAQERAVTFASSSWRCRQ
jgi:hypothetical protein